MKKGQKAALTLIISLIVLVVLVLNSTKLITDWYWFQEINHTNLFTKTLLTQVYLGLGVGLFVLLWLWVNFKIVNRAVTQLPEKTFTWKERARGTINVRTVKLSPIVKKVALAFAWLTGIIFGLTASAQWENVLTFINRTPFNQTDPMLGKDIGFYFFSLPFLEMISGLAVGLMVVSIISVLVMYLVNGGIEFTKNATGVIKGGWKSIASSVRQHISIIAAVFFVIIAVRLYYLDIPSLVFSNTGPFTGASYSDITARLPILQVGSIIALLLVLILLVNVIKPVTRWFWGMLGIYFLVVAIGGWAVPDLLQRFIVLPNELVKETPYIQRNILATQAAFGLDNVEKRELTGETTLTQADIEANPTTIQNVRLWDREPLLDTFGQIQEIRTYYDFTSIDNDRYTIDGDYRQVLLSPRELNSASLPQRNFINEHLTFTHGYGLTLGPVNEVTPEGLPVLFVQDLPPQATIESLAINRPEIYYGELANEFVVVNSQAKEFNYPSGEENVFTEYQGTGGVPVKSLFRKALFALRFQSMKILLSNDITGSSRVQYYRDIKQRVRRAVPFLKFDKDPYMVIDGNGQLKWIYDAYTVSDKYPYSEKVSDTILGKSSSQVLPGRLNYIRNSVKIVIDAYSGTMEFYISDPQDPIIQTYSKIYPGNFLSFDQMPEDLKKHIRFPETLFQYLTSVYSTYHMEDEQIFYNREDQWEIPTRPEAETDDPFMRHIIMKLPEEENEEYILMLPFTPRGKDNLSAWMVARNDGEYYGQLVVYRFPKQKLVYGPQQITNRINQDPKISEQISLWDQRGSQVIRGNLLVIPIESSLLYVQPIYLRAEGGRIPELKRVIVANENRIAMEETLDKALAQIFNQTAASTETQDETEVTESDDLDSSLSSLIEQAQAAYQSALQAQTKGDWSQYGVEIEKLGGILNQLP
ncbi:MAG: UPF0182 family protein [bacterium]